MISLTLVSNNLRTSNGRIHLPAQEDRRRLLFCKEDEYRSVTRWLLNSSQANQAKKGVRTPNSGCDKGAYNAQQWCSVKLVVKYLNFTNSFQVDRAQFISVQLEAANGWRHFYTKSECLSTIDDTGG